MSLHIPCVLRTMLGRRRNYLPITASSFRGQSVRVVEYRNIRILSTMSQHPRANVMILRHLPLAVILGVAFTSCSPSGSEYVQRSPSRSFKPVRSNPTPSIVTDENKVIDVSDSVSFSVWGYPEFTTRAVVKSNGMVSLPFIGEQPAAGLTRAQLKANLEKRLSESLNGEIKIGLEITPVPGRITVIGSVAHPGSFPASFDLPMLEVLALAGGWTEGADLRYTKINRPPTETQGGEVLDINLQFVLEQGNVRDLPLVKPGDAVYVPQADNLVREFSGFFRDAVLLLGFIGLLTL